MRILALFPNACTGTRVSHICVALCECMARHVPTRMYCYTLESGFRSSVACPAVPGPLTRLAWRVDRLSPFIARRTVQKYLRDTTQPTDWCWLWPGTNAAAARTLRDRGSPIVVEAINCHQVTARRILDAEYQRLGWQAPQPRFTEAGIATEQELYCLADLVFAPSPKVAESLLENGVPETKIIRSSYGWSPSRFPAGASLPEGHGDDVTVLFAGAVYVRKGPHLLVQAWKAAGIKGRLLLAGRIMPELCGREAEYLSGPNVQLLGPVKDMASLMHSADIFAFPTLEEGSPLVIYEAAATGKAILTTPMGAGGIIRNGVDGIVLDPHDHDAWVGQLRTLAADPDLRARLGAAARERARDFTWEKVAQRRLASLDAASRGARTGLREPNDVSEQTLHAEDVGTAETASR